MEDNVAPVLTPLVRALTRAPTLFGVPYMFSMFNMVATATIFLATKSLLTLSFAVPIHSFGYILTLRDDQIFSILKVRSSRCPPQAGGVWNLRSYKPGSDND